MNPPSIGLDTDWQSFFGLPPGTLEFKKPTCKEFSNGMYEVTWPIVIHPEPKDSEQWQPSEK